MTYELTVSDEDLDTAARILYGEARGEPLIGKQAVCWVMRNRATWRDYDEDGKVVLPWWGSTVKEVCLHPYQFSCNNKNDPNYHVIWALQKDDPRYINMVEIVREVMAGKIEDITQGATMYKVRGTKASWDAEIEKLNKLPIEIGAHDFYKLGPKE